MTINLYWWRWNYPSELNFGDEISAPIIRRLTGRRVEWASLSECSLVAAGSVLGTIVAKRRELPQIWGTGFMRPSTTSQPNSPVLARAVRGALSLRRIENESGTHPVAQGDPGILADILLDKPVAKSHMLGIIPHYVDEGNPKFVLLAKRSGVKVIDVRTPPEDIVKDISSCEAVLSSSLHGLIVADALGVPNLHYPVSDKLSGGSFKFRDYYSAFPDRAYDVYLPRPFKDIGAEEIVMEIESRWSLGRFFDTRRYELIKALHSAV